MLKPKRKITKQEIKRDPFLETIDKLESNFEKNKRTFLNIFLGLIAAAFAINFIIKKQEQKNLDSKSALGIAIVAYDNSDYENAKFQFESIISEFNGTKAHDISNFYLGRIHFEKNEFVKSKSFLNAFIKSGDLQNFYIGALKMLTHIALQNDEHEKAISMLDNGISKTSKINSIEIKLIKTLVLKDKGNINEAKSLINEIITEEKLPRHLKQKSEEIIGMM